MKIFDLLQDAVYDIVGYILPGLITLPFLLLIYYSGLTNSSIYYLYYSISNINNLTNLKTLLNINFSNCISILICAYIIGLLLKYISLFINNLLSYNHVNKVLKNKAFYFIYKLFRYKLNKSDYSSKTLKNIINSKSYVLYNNYNELASNIDFKDLFNNEHFLQEYARTTARFNKHNNLNQKYIAKTNFFSSLSSLFFIEFLNSIISLIVYSINGTLCIINNCYFFSYINIFSPIIITSILSILFIACYSEFKDHKNYQLNENFFYLIETYYKKSGQSSDS